MNIISRLLNKLDEQYAAKINDISEIDPTEADRLVVELLSKLGLYKTAQAFKHCDKFYM